MVACGFRDVYEMGEAGLSYLALMIERLLIENGLFMSTGVVFSTDQEGHFLELS